MPQVDLEGVTAWTAEENEQGSTKAEAHDGRDSERISDDHDYDFEHGATLRDVAGAGDYELPKGDELAEVRRGAQLEQAASEPGIVPADRDGGVNPQNEGAQAEILDFPTGGRKTGAQAQKGTPRPGAQKRKNTGAHAPRGVAGNSRPKVEDETKPPVPEGTTHFWYVAEREGAGWRFRKRWVETEGGVEVNRTLYLFRIGGGAWARLKERYTYEQIRIIIADKIKRRESLAARRSA